MNYPYPQLQPPKFCWNLANKPASDLKMHQWIQTLAPNKEINWDSFDVTILGVPLSRSSISASAASENPNAIRQAWQYFTTYSLDYDIDLSPLNVVDLGDVRQSVTDIAQCHQNISDAMYAMRTHHPKALPIMVGGDHSITAMLIKGWKKAHPDQKIGILQLDTHFDLRSLDDGPSNGTPIRNLIENDVIHGENVWNIGLHGYFNAKSLKEYAEQKGVHYVTLKEARKIGIPNVLEQAIEQLQKNQVDIIYFTVDMDVLDIAYAPGVPAATPGGMRTDELFDLVYTAGKNPLVQAMDIVCLDPYKDLAQATVKSGVHVILSFLTGFASR